MARWPVASTEPQVRLHSGPTNEGYLEKLAKYVPVEGLAPAIVTAELAKASDLAIWVTWSACLIVGVGLVLYQLNNKAPDVPDPRWWFWPLFVAGFYVWTVGASDEFRQIFNLKTWAAKWALSLGAFAIPGIDMFCEQFVKWRSRPKTDTGALQQGTAAQ